MRLRLILLAIGSGLLVLLVLAVPMSAVLRNSATQEIDIQLTEQIKKFGFYLLEGPTVAEALTYLDAAQADSALVKYTLLTNDGRLYGEDIKKFGTDRIGPPGGTGPPERRPVETLFVTLRQEGGDRTATMSLADGSNRWRVSGRVYEADIRTHEADARQWMALLGLLSLLVAAAVGGIMALSLGRTVQRAAQAADAVGRGRFDTKVPEKGPGELVRLGHALNVLSQRVQRLLELERQRAAELSHRLRTPMTAVQHAAERIAATSPHAPAEVQAEVESLAVSVARLEGELDEVIRRTRSVGEETEGTTSDLRRVLADCLNFWQTLARDDLRIVEVDVPRTEILVPLPITETTAIIDHVLENVFRHTPVGTGFRVELKSGVYEAILTVRNEVEGTLSEREIRSGTGLGLSFVDHSLKKVGGGLRVNTSPRDTFVAELVFPRANQNASMLSEIHPGEVR